MNNPMKYTDPSGYFLVGMFKKYWRTFLSIAIAVYMPGMNFMMSLTAVQQGAIVGFVSGLVSTGSLRGAIIGSLTGAAFGKLHGFKTSLVAKGIDFGRVLAHGTVGGVSSVLSGGKFGHGFVSAGATQFASEALGDDFFVEGSTKIADRAANAAKAALVGGTVSYISGGKFGNGAITGAYSRLLNDDSIFQKTQSRIMRDMKPPTTTTTTLTSEVEMDFKRFKITAIGKGEGARIDELASSLAVQGKDPISGLGAEINFEVSKKFSVDEWEFNTGLEFTYDVVSGSPQTYSITASQYLSTEGIGHKVKSCVLSLCSTIDTRTNAIHNLKVNMSYTEYLYNEVKNSVIKLNMGKEN